MQSSFSVIAASVILSLALGGCAATSPIVSEWRNPAYSSRFFKRVMVGALGSDTSIRRNMEDELSIRLRAAGVDAVPSYLYVTDTEKIDEAMLKQAAAKAGADALLFARSVQVEQKTQYSPSYFPHTSFGIFGSNVGATWHGLGGAPRVHRYNEYISETTLLDLGKNEVVWTGTLKTTEPEDVRAAIRSYADAVMKALEAQKLIGHRH